MICLSVNKIAKSFAGIPVLKDISFSLKEGQRIGLVGVNGSGKSTLLKIIAQETQPDSGDIIVSDFLRIGYLEQSWVPKLGQTVKETVLEIFEDLIKAEEKLNRLSDAMAEEKNPEALEKLGEDYSKVLHFYEANDGYSFRSKIKGVLSGLGFVDGFEDREANTLSGGELTRLNLARLLLTKPDILLLDEPTNHLDIHALAWLEEFLLNYKGSVIAVSHDRFFLDRVCTDMLEILFGVSEFYPGNYSVYMSLRAERFESRMRAYTKQQEEIERQKQIIERFRSFNREKSIRAAESRQKKIDKLQLIDKPIEEKQIFFRFTANKRMGEEALVVKELTKSFDGVSIFENISLFLSEGDRAIIIGDNGIGKTTLLESITGAKVADSGTVKIGSNAQMGYYDQKLQSLHDDKTILREVWDGFPRLSQTEIRSALAQFQFLNEDVYKEIKSLSGGEKSRVALTKLMLRHDNLLILDEPTNHLDAESREVLEEALSKYNGTILAVSHDRYFINKIATKVLLLSRNSITEYPGNFDDFIAQQEKEKQFGEDYTPGITKTQLAKNRKRTKETEKQIQQLKNNVKKAEQEVLKAEEVLEEIEKQLSESSLYQDSDKINKVILKHNEAQQCVEEAYTKWQHAEEALDEFIKNIDND
ncbi:MAG: ABC-F family ATP-binding cassette domain-containing protein [Eubacteriales bacterium]|nr:ABC-F family ATP-binding cassette domain-containing protein [Eubacteriales bacterium]